MAKNKSQNIQPVGVSTKEAEEVQSAEEQLKRPKTKLKKITCPRCKGDGIWHSNKTGYRAKTAGNEALVDHSKKCPDCNGTKKAIIIVEVENNG